MSKAARFSRWLVFVILPMPEYKIVCRANNLKLCALLLFRKLFCGKQISRGFIVVLIRSEG